MIDEKLGTLNSFIDYDFYITIYVTAFLGCPVGLYNQLFVTSK